MADNQTKAALGQAVLSARIKFTTGTADQWIAANPVLLKGEVGFVENTTPAEFKVGDGTTKWLELGWGQPTSLAQLVADATHRLVTDAQIAGWNNKAEKTAATTAADGLMSAADKTKLNGIAAGANNYVHPSTHPATMITADASHRFVTDAEKTTWNNKAPKSHATADPTYGVGTDTEYGHVKLVDAVSEDLGAGSGVAATPKALFSVAEDAYAALETANEARAALANKVDKVTGKGLSTNDYTTAEKNKLAGIAAGANNYVHPSTHAATMITEDATHRFATDAEKAKWNLEYTVEKVATESGFASTYVLKKGGIKVGVSINIPLDQVLRSSSIKTVTTANTPYSGAKVNDKYIEFLFQNNNTPQYLPVQDLVDVYKGGRGIYVSAENVISLNNVEVLTDLTPSLKTLFDTVYDPLGAGVQAATQAIEEFEASEFIIQCSIPGMP